MTGSGHSEGITMSAGGLYSLATIGAKHVIDAATPIVIDAIDKLPLDSIQSGFTISDMGTADAGTSLSMITKVVDAVAARAPGAPVTVVYSDQPRNDFNALIANVYGLGSYESYLERHADIFPLVSGTSFYRQIVPTNTLDIGFSATAMHWLSAKVCNLSNHVQAVGAQGEELEAFRVQAHRDWRQILLHRARELKPGGKLVLINFARDEQGRYLGNTGGVNMFDTFNQIWLDFLQQDRISREEYENMTLPQYYNTVEEFSAPLVDADEPVYQAGLRALTPNPLMNMATRRDLPKNTSRRSAAGMKVYFSTACRTRARSKNANKSSRITTAPIETWCATTPQATVWTTCTPTR